MSTAIKIREYIKFPQEKKDAFMPFNYGPALEGFPASRMNSGKIIYIIVAYPNVLCRVQ